MTAGRKLVTSLVTFLSLAIPVSGEPQIFRKDVGADPTPSPVVIDVHIKITITVDVKPGPGPGPGPEPVDPPPIPPNQDPLIQKLVEAGKQDGVGGPDFDTYAKAFNKCKDAVAEATNNANLQTKLAKALANNIPGGIRKNVKAVFSEALTPLDELAPTSRPTQLITDAARREITALFDKLAKACQNAVTQFNR